MMIGNMAFILVVSLHSNADNMAFKLNVMSDYILISSI